MNTRAEERPRLLLGATVLETVRSFMLEQALYLAAAEFDVHLFCDGCMAESVEPGAVPSERSLHLHDVAIARTMSPLADVLSLVNLLRLVRRLRPDVLMTGTPKAGLLGLLAAALSRVPNRIYLVRGLRMEGLSGASYWVSLNAERLACRLATHIVSVSPSLRDEIVGLNITSRQRVTVLGSGGSNGVDIDHFRPPSPSESADARALMKVGPSAKVIGFAGRLTVDKGIGELLSVMNDLYARFPNVCLLVAGSADGTDPMPPEQAELLSAPWCRIVGQVADMRLFYWSLDLFCLPSRREGMPNVNLEAAACGLPVVTSMATGCRDSVEDTVTGLLFRVGDSAALETALVALLEDETEAKLMGARGRRRIVALFSRTVVWENLRAFLRTTIRQNDMQP